MIHSGLIVLFLCYNLTNLFTQSPSESFKAELRSLEDQPFAAQDRHDQYI